MKLAVIPARGGSKRIPRKNIRPFRGLPIIAYSIRAAQEAGIFDRIIVSTDDAEIAAVARDHGAETPFVRPREIADDQATTGAVVIHALQWFAEQGMPADEVCCIYPTAPLIRAQDIVAAAALMESSGASYCFPVTSFPFPIQRAVRVTATGRLAMLHPEHLLTRSQDLEECYHDAGQFYWGKTEAYLHERPMFGADAVPLVIPRYRVQDIDTPEDWQQAELLHEALKWQTGD